MEPVRTVRFAGRTIGIWPAVVGLVLISRLLLSLVGVVSAAALADNHVQESSGALSLSAAAREEISPWGLINQWYSWDAFHYENLSRTWMEIERPIAPHIVTEDGGRAWNEFSWPPAYPLIVAGLSALAPGDAGLVMVVFGVILFMGLLRVIAAISAEDGDSEAMVGMVLLTVVVAPVSFILSIPMTEPLFTLTGALCLLALRRHRWASAGIWAAFMVWTKMSGVYMIAPLVLAAAIASLPALRSRGHRGAWRPVVAPWLAPLGCGLGYVAYLGFAWFMTGTPRAPFDTQRYGWGNEVGNPLWSLIDGLGFWQYRFVVGLSAWAIWLAWRRFITPVDLVFSLVMFLSTLPVDLVAAAPRYAAVGFPVWIGTARWVRGARWRWGALAACAAGQTWLFVLWSNDWLVEIV